MQLYWLVVESGTSQPIARTPGSAGRDYLTPNIQSAEASNNSGQAIPFQHNYVSFDGNVRRPITDPQ